jgi:hypothetical protein
VNADDLLAARSSLSRTAVLDAIGELASNDKTRIRDWRAVHRLAQELAEAAGDLRTWADDHRRQPQPRNADRPSRPRGADVDDLALGRPPTGRMTFPLSQAVNDPVRPTELTPRESFRVLPGDRSG